MIFRRLKLLKGSKVSGKYSDWYNIKNVNDNTISSIDWKSVDKWKQYTQEEALSIHWLTIFSDFDITNAILDELKWKTQSL